MTKAIEYVQKIAQYDRENLLGLWRAIERGQTPDWEPGRALEYLVLRAFELEGADVRWPFPIEVDSQIVEEMDGAVYSDGLACLVQTKDHAAPIDVQAIARLYYQLLRRPPGVIGLVFSRSGFSNAASVVARYTTPQRIVLWNGNEIKWALGRSAFRRGLLMKCRLLIEEGSPESDIVSEDSA